jgi:hypothetical protein
MFSRARWYFIAGAWLLVPIIALLDYVTGYEIGFFVFYFIPLALANLGGGRRLGLVLAFVCAVVWLIVDITSAHPYSSVWYQYWNALICYVAFALASVLMSSRTQALLEQERELTARLTRALEEVKELRGLLPICAACKKIRNDQGFWELLETYIAAHSKAEFTHSLCPECAHHLYPDIFPLPAGPHMTPAAEKHDA